MQKGSDEESWLILVILDSSEKYSDEIWSHDAIDLDNWRWVEKYQVNKIYPLCKHGYSVYKLDKSHYNILSNDYGLFCFIGVLPLLLVFLCNSVQTTNVQLTAVSERVYMLVHACMWVYSNISVWLELYLTVNCVWCLKESAERRLMSTCVYLWALFPSLGMQINSNLPLSSD